MHIGLRSAVEIPNEGWGRDQSAPKKPRGMTTALRKIVTEHHFLHFRCKYKVVIRRKQFEDIILKDLNYENLKLVGRERGTKYYLHPLPLHIIEF